MRRSWLNAPIVFIPKPACPGCGATRYVRVHTDNEGDGTTTRRVVCDGCSAPYKIVFEYPERDVSDFDGDTITAERKT